MTAPRSATDIRDLGAYSYAQAARILEVAQSDYGIARPFLHQDFRHDGRGFFLDTLGQLMPLSRSRQLYIREMLAQYLKRIEYGPDKLSAAFYPVIGERPKGPKLVLVNPTISFGRPVIARTGIRTSAIISRVDAGETRGHVIEDYGLTAPEYDEAWRLEAA